MDYTTTATIAAVVVTIAISPLQFILWWTHILLLLLGLTSLHSLCYSQPASSPLLPRAPSPTLLPLRHLLILPVTMDGFNCARHSSAAGQWGSGAVG